MIEYRHLTTTDYDAVIELGNRIHGDNYLTLESLADYDRRGRVGAANLNWLAFLDGELAGIRLTFAPGQWELDAQCSPDQWPFPAEQLCYFKCAAVDPKTRGTGIGRELLNRSIAEAKTLGCRAGLAHIWMQSPGNAAFEYFTHCGGQLIREHPNRWHDLSLYEGYHCPVCDGICYCSAAEMLLIF